MRRTFLGRDAWGWGDKEVRGLYKITPLKKLITWLFLLIYELSLPTHHEFTSGGKWRFFLRSEKNRIQYSRHSSEMYRYIFSTPFPSKKEGGGVVQTLRGGEYPLKGRAPFAAHATDSPSSPRMYWDNLFFIIFLLYREPIDLNIYRKVTQFLFQQFLKSVLSYLRFWKVCLPMDDIWLFSK